MATKLMMVLGVLMAAMGWVWLYRAIPPELHDVMQGMTAIVLMVCGIAIALYHSAAITDIDGGA